MVFIIFFQVYQEHYDKVDCFISRAGRPLEVNCVRTPNTLALGQFHQKAACNPSRLLYFYNILRSMLPQWRHVQLNVSPNPHQIAVTIRLRLARKPEFRDSIIDTRAGLPNSWHFARTGFAA